MQKPIRKTIKGFEDYKEPAPRSRDEYIHFLGIITEDTVSHCRDLPVDNRREYFQSRIEEFLLHNPPPMQPVRFCNFVENHAKSTWKGIPRHDKNQLLMPDADFKKLRYNLIDMLEKEYRNI